MRFIFIYNKLANLLENITLFKMQINIIFSVFEYFCFIIFNCKVTNDKSDEVTLIDLKVSASRSQFKKDVII